MTYGTTYDRYIYIENLQQTRLCGARSGSPQLYCNSYCCITTGISQTFLLHSVRAVTVSYTDNGLLLGAVILIQSSVLRDVRWLITYIPRPSASNLYLSKFKDLSVQWIIQNHSSACHNCVKSASVLLTAAVWILSGEAMHSMCRKRTCSYTW